MSGLPVIAAGESHGLPTLGSGSALSAAHVDHDYFFRQTPHRDIRSGSGVWSALRHRRQIEPRHTEHAKRVDGRPVSGVSRSIYMLGGNGTPPSFFR